MTSFTDDRPLSIACVVCALVIAGCSSTGASQPAGPAPVEFKRGQMEADRRATGTPRAPVVSGYNASRRDGAPAPDPYASDPYAAEPSLAVAEPMAVGAPIEVLPGDTLFGVSSRYSVAMRALIETNDLAPPFALSPGQTLYLPPPNIHVVEGGETLYSISRRYNVDTRSLALMNGLPKPWTIQPGDEIVLPALARDQNAAQLAPPPLPRRRNIVDAPINAPAPIDRNAPPPKSVPGVASSAGFQWPVLGPVVKPFGPGAGGQKNDGVNIEAGAGAPIAAAADGEVVYAGDELEAFGNLLLIRHKDGWVTAYAHADNLLVREGDAVSRGQVVAQVGSSGSVSSPQLHFELRKGRQVVDPKKYLPELRTS